MDKVGQRVIELEQENLRLRTEATRAKREDRESKTKILKLEAENAALQRQARANRR